MSDQYDFFVISNKGVGDVTLTPVSAQALKFFPQLFPELLIGQSVTHSLEDIKLIVDTFIPSTYQIKWLSPLNPPQRSTSSPPTPSSAPEKGQGKIRSTTPTTTPEPPKEENAPSVSQKQSKTSSSKAHHSVSTEPQSKGSITPREQNGMSNIKQRSYYSTSHPLASKRYKKIIRSLQTCPKMDGKTLTISLSLNL